ncbi:MAG: hypothetical protein DI568_06640 [Sphingomonas sp.]|nr:MAG: hypothetical protein DI568_06640 [Sphingomonas sp.]
MTRKALDPNLASILDSIRATVGGDTPPPAPEPEPEEIVEEPEAPALTAAKPKAPRKTAPAVPPPAVSGGKTVEEFLAELIRPQVDAWLKANLPELIQKMAADEIARLTGRK